MWMEPAYHITIVERSQLTKILRRPQRLFTWQRAHVSILAYFITIWHLTHMTLHKRANKKHETKWWCMWCGAGCTRHKRFYVPGDCIPCATWHAQNIVGRSDGLALGLIPRTAAHMAAQTALNALWQSLDTRTHSRALHSPWVLIQLLYSHLYLS
jgi:hypothetical protein